MEKVIGVRFKRVGKVYYFSPGSIVFKKGDFAIVETTNGKEYGEVVIARAVDVGHLGDQLLSEG